MGCRWSEMMLVCSNVVSNRITNRVYKLKTTFQLIIDDVT